VKKKKSDGNNLNPAVNGGSAKRDRRLKSAIETVFRLTHRRDMTAKERREFGLNAPDSNHKSNGRKNGRSRDAKRQESELR